MAEGNGSQNPVSHLDILPAELFEIVLHDLPGEDITELRKQNKRFKARVDYKLKNVKQVKILPYVTKFEGDDRMSQCSFILFEILDDPLYCMTIYGPKIHYYCLGTHYMDSLVGFLARKCPNLELLYAPYSDISSSVLQQLANRLRYFSIMRLALNHEMEIDNFTNLEAFDVYTLDAWYMAIWNWYNVHTPKRFIQMVYFDKSPIHQNKGVAYLYLHAMWQMGVETLSETLTESLKVLRLKNVSFNSTPILKNLWVLEIHNSRTIDVIFDSLKECRSLKMLHLVNEIPLTLVATLTELLNIWDKIQTVSIKFENKSERPGCEAEVEKTIVPFIFPVHKNLCKLHIDTQRAQSVPIHLAYHNFTNLENLNFIQLVSTLVEIRDFIFTNVIQVDIKKLPVDRTDVLQVLSQCQFLKNVSIEYDLDYAPIDPQDMQMFGGYNGAHILPASLLKRLNMIPLVEENDNNVKVLVRSCEMKFIFQSEYPKNDLEYFPAQITLHDHPMKQSVSSDTLNQEVSYKCSIDINVPLCEILRQGLILMGLAGEPQAEPVAGLPLDG